MAQQTVIEADDGGAVSVVTALVVVALVVVALAWYLSARATEANTITIDLPPAVAGTATPDR
ncbi:MAG: hypothetical protein ABI697_06655 [Devosia sp.]